MPKIEDVDKVLEESGTAHVLKSYIGGFPSPRMTPILVRLL